METKNLKNFNKIVSNIDTSWIDDLNDFNNNSNWLDISFEISLSVLSKLSENKKNKIGIYNQKMLASALGCSAQYVNKLLKGNENLTLDTICNLQNVLKIKLIEVVKYESISSYSYSELLTQSNLQKIDNVTISDSSDYDTLNKNAVSVTSDNTSYALAA